MIERETEAAVERLLDVAWTSIAASGWNRYQLHGRGALLASMSMLEGKSNTMDYLTPSEQAPLPAWLAMAISRYDPQTSVVLVLVKDEVFRSAARPAAADLLDEHVGVLSGQAYFKIATRLPPPPECARKTAN